MFVIGLTFSTSGSVFFLDSYGGIVSETRFAKKFRSRRKAYQHSRTCGALAIKAATDIQVYNTLFTPRVPRREPRWFDRFVKFF